MTVAQVIERAYQAGVSLTVTGDRLRLEADAAPPEDLLREIASSKGDIIKLLAHGDLDLWRRGVERLKQMQCPSGYSYGRWSSIVEAADAFLDQWGTKAAARGWMTEELFAVNARSPDGRIDHMGLVSLLPGRRVLSVTTDSIGLITRSGVGQTFRKKTPLRAPGRVPLWELPA